jgi:hypothetical protein
VSAPERFPKLDARAAHRLALALLGIAMVASTALLLYWGRGQTIRGDELGYAARLADDSFLHAVLHSPPNKYFIAVPLVLYDAMFNLFGLAADLPYRLVSTALVLLCGCLFFAIARRRLGDLLAVPPTALLLLFGSGWETVMTPIRIPSLIAVAAGLGALIVLERRDRAGDLAAAVLLTIGVASHPVGLSFLAAAGVFVIARPSPRRWTSLWLLAVPAAAFGAWWLFLRAPTTDVIFPTRAIDIVEFAIDSWTAITAHVSGLAGVIDQPSFDHAIAQVAAAVLFAALVVAVALRRGRVPASFWAALAGLVVLVVATRLSPGGFLRSPEEVRYLFPEAVLFLLVLTELAAFARVRGVAALAAAVVLVLGLVYNADQLRKAGPHVRASSSKALGQYSAYELAGSGLHRSYRPSDFETSAGEYVDAAAAYGSVADSPEALQTAPAIERRAADAALVGALGIAVRPTHGSRLAMPPPPRVVRTLAARASHGRDCLRLSPRPPTDSAGSPVVPLIPNPSKERALKRILRGLPAKPTKAVPALAEVAPRRGGLSLVARDIGDTAVLLGRFLEPPTAQLDRPPHGRAGLLLLPDDGLNLPWHVTVASSEPIGVCGAGLR